MLFKMMYSASLILLLAASICTIVMCRPSDVTSAHHQLDPAVDASEYYGNLSQDTIRKLQKCDMDMDVMELCMRCAKVTKAENVYPMCCGNDFDVQTWCHNYIYYGTKS